VILGCKKERANHQRKGGFLTTPELSLATALSEGQEGREVPSGKKATKLGQAYLNGGKKGGGRSPEKEKEKRKGKTFCGSGGKGFVIWPNNEARTPVGGGGKKRGRRRALRKKGTLEGGKKKEEPPMGKGKIC